MQIMLAAITDTTWTPQISCKKAFFVTQQSALRAPDLTTSPSLNLKLSFLSIL